MMTYNRIIHGGETFSRDRIVIAPQDSEDFRADATISDDGRFVLLCYGRSGHKDMPVNRSFSGIFTLDGGPESDITMSAGDKWTVKWERGLILKGKLL